MIRTVKFHFLHRIKLLVFCQFNLFDLTTNVVKVSSLQLISNFLLLLLSIQDMSKKLSLLYRIKLQLKVNRIQSHFLNILNRLKQLLRTCVQQDVIVLLLRLRYLFHSCHSNYYTKISKISKLNLVTLKIDSSQNIDCIFWLKSILIYFNIIKLAIN
jgi:hypothetical protein